jgi:hypothetical protein
MPLAGSRIGRITIERYGHVHELILLQPGCVNGRAPRSDWIALADGRVMSLAAACADLARCVGRVLTRRERAEYRDHPAQDGVN